MKPDPTTRERRLRRSLDAAADQTPIPDGWDEIRRRVAGQTPEEVIPMSSDAVPRRRRVALLAALVLIVVGVTGAAVLAARTSGDPDPSSVVAGEPADTAPTATGWYIPAELPVGWTVESVAAHDGRPRCATGGLSGSTTTPSRPS